MSRRLVLYLAALATLIYSAFPFYWAIVSSLRSGAALFETDLIPRSASLVNYAAIFTNQNFGRNLFNSTIVACSTVLLSTALALPASYALARRQFRGRKPLLFLFLGVSMFPQISILAGLFEVVRALGLYNHWGAMILGYLTLTLPFTIWTLTVFLRAVPRGLEDAARIDGAGPWTILFRVLMPLVAPATVTTGLLAFIAAWNEFLFALTFTFSDRARTVPVAIAYIGGASGHELPWGNIMAASVVVTVPLIVLVLIFQNRIVAGLTAGAIKG
jgi:trehalose/maltose transport system permease protein